MEKPYLTKLKSMLVDFNMTNQEAASKLGVPLGTFRKWVNGQRVPSASAVNLINYTYDIIKKGEL